MKKAILVIAMILGFAVAVSAQPRALGLRAGNLAELSYQHSIGSNFLEADLGWINGYGIYLTGIYDFVFAQAGDFNFYAGPGAKLGVYSGGGSSALNLAVAGQLGAEWEIPTIPLNISLDWRPTYYFMYGGFLGWDVALGIRYCF